jgi:hypothetical protein
MARIQSTRAFHYLKKSSRVFIIFINGLKLLYTEMHAWLTISHVIYHHPWNPFFFGGNLGVILRSQS